MPWTNINEYLLDIGKERNPKDLCLKAFRSIEPLIPYDSGLLYLFDDSLKPIKQVFKNMDEKRHMDYLEYYSKLENGCFSYLSTYPEMIDWDSFRDCEFKRDYIRPQRIKFTTSMRFFSADKWIKASFVINRITTSGFSQNELEIFRVIRSHLSNLHANLYVSVSADENYQGHPARLPIQPGGLTSSWVHPICASW